MLMKFSQSIQSSEISAGRDPNKFTADIYDTQQIISSVFVDLWHFFECNDQAKCSTYALHLEYV